MSNSTPTEMLRQIKEATGLGQIGLSKRIGISQPAVNRILNGQPGCSSDTFIKIMRVHAEVVAQTPVHS